MNYPIYLDNNATTQCDPRVVEAMLPFFTENFGNASSGNHIFGWKAQEAVELAREQVAKLINATPSEIYFTSGATEANNLVIKGIFEKHSEKGNHIITTKIEHKSILETCKYLEKKGAEVTYLDVDKNGNIDLKQLESAIKPVTILIAIMFANNEIGTINPVQHIGEIAKKNNIPFFSDAVQALGKIDIDVEKQGFDMLSVSAHKMYGPKGVGALYIRKNKDSAKILAQIVGGGQENNIRSGTLNVTGIVGFGTACELAFYEMKEYAGNMFKLRNYLEQELIKFPGSLINGNASERLPNLLNITFSGSDVEFLLTQINKKVAVSNGSACSSISQKPSYVLKEIGLSDDQAFSSIRFGLSRFTTKEEIDSAIKHIEEVFK
ncbi:cysteine desulfurase family protein [Epilithonimonas sp. UC225_85]|uniref:cysteine desulfurase family protein n=1 Tax=Epilithonimonas sp. UC225_85 TaxID=3350167 RepID=UPI0036D4294E